MSTERLPRDNDDPSDLIGISNVIEIISVDDTGSNVVINKNNNDLSNDISNDEITDEDNDENKKKSGTVCCF